MAPARVLAGEAGRGPGVAPPGPLLGGVEAGGTKFVCVIGRGPDAIEARQRIEVAEPGRTIGAAVRFFEGAAERGLPVAALGVGSFGPVELDAGSAYYGRITATPKPGWSGTDMVGPWARALGVPVGFDTDVNAAALAEGKWGAARGLDAFVYLTVGTGIGGGSVVGGRLLRGRGHPEMGHLAVPRRDGDRFDGVCPFHGACLEGMASGPAIAARFGRRAEALDPAGQARAVEIVAWYLGAGVANLVYALAPQRVVVGGGVAQLPGLLDAVRAELGARLHGYPGVAAHGEAGFLAPAALGGMAGPAGALLLAERALHDSGTKRGPGNPRGRAVE